MRQADEIHFNLDGFDSQSYQKYLADCQDFINQRNITDPTKLNWFDKDNRQITNWEYYTTPNKWANNPNYVEIIP